MSSRCAPSTSPIGPTPGAASTKAPCCEWLQSSGPVSSSWTCKAG